MSAEDYNPTLEELLEMKKEMLVRLRRIDKLIKEKRREEGK